MFVYYSTQLSRHKNHKTIAVRFIQPYNICIINCYLKTIYEYIKGCNVDTIIDLKF